MPATVSKRKPRPARTEFEIKLREAREKCNLSLGQASKRMIYTSYGTLQYLEGQSTNRMQGGSSVRQPAIPGNIMVKTAIDIIDCYEGHVSLRDFV